MRARVSLVVIGLIASLVMLPSAPASAACGWNVQPTPNRGTDADNFAMDADYASKRLGWVIGYYWPGSGSRLFSMRWDGVSWKSVKTPTPGGDASALSIAALGDGTAWTVGFSSATLSSFRMHFNGTKWVEVAGPKNEPAGTSLYGVAAVGPRNVWAVGGTGSDSVVERWDGRRWKLMDHPRVPLATQSLSSVAHVPGTKDVWVAGTYSDGPIHPLAMLWSGGSWQPPAVPDPGQGIVQGIAASGTNDAWLVGYRNVGGATPTYTAHWNGSDWTTIASPSPSSTFPGNYLYGVAAPAEGFAYAAGVSYVSGSGNDPLTLGWDGGAWQDVTPFSGDDAFEFRGVASIPGSRRVSLIGFERVGGASRTRVVTGC